MKRFWLYCTAAIALWGAQPALAEWSLLGRYSTGNLDYSFFNQDTQFKGSTSAVVDLFGFELRYRDPPQASELWKLQMSFNVEFLRQVLVSQSYINPRVSARFSPGAETFITERRRTAPIFELHGQQAVLANALSGGNISQAAIFRFGVGLGAQLALRFHTSLTGIGDYRKLWLELVATGLVRWDTGGNASILPSALNDSFTFHGEVGATVWISKSHSLDLRVRSLQDVFAWPSVNNSTSQNSMSNEMLLFDFGIGWRF